MKRILLFLIPITLVALIMIACAIRNNKPDTTTAGHALKQVSTIDLPGTKGKRFDYLTIDYKDNYLLSAHLGADMLYVIDLKTSTLVKAIPDCPGAEGVEF